MTHSKVRDDYFEWMYNKVCQNRYDNGITYRKLLSYLHRVEFTYMLRNDEDRAYDGIQLRHRYALLFEDDYEYVRYCLGGGPCSVLEMIVALAIRCEESIMDDPQIGDRTGQWFWDMMVSLGLGSMTDSRFDECYIYDTIMRFMDRDYSPDGHGGLFTIRNCEMDVSRLPIWTQMCYFLRSIM